MGIAFLLNDHSELNFGGLVKVGSNVLIIVSRCQYMYIYIANILLHMIDYCDGHSKSIPL